MIKNSTCCCNSREKSYIGIFILVSLYLLFKAVTHNSRAMDPWKELRRSNSHTFLSLLSKSFSARTSSHRTNEIPKTNGLHRSCHSRHLWFWRKMYERVTIRSSIYLYRYYVGTTWVNLYIEIQSTCKNTIIKYLKNRFKVYPNYYFLIEIDQYLPNRW